MEGLVLWRDRHFIHCIEGRNYGFTFRQFGRSAGEIIEAGAKQGFCLASITEERRMRELRYMQKSSYTDGT